jgi:hypothetical protein
MPDQGYHTSEDSDRQVWKNGEIMITMGKSKELCSLQTLHGVTND